jgi:hypothetical protein
MYLNPRSDWHWLFMADARVRVRVSGFTHVNTWLFVVLLSIWPLAIPMWAAHHSFALASRWFIAVFAIVLIQALFWYARLRCSNQSVSYWNGLLIVAASMSTGWAQMSFLIILPTLLAVFLASLLFAIYAEVRRVPEEAATRFQGLLKWFYAHRMRQ